MPTLQSISKKIPKKCRTHVLYDAQTAAHWLLDIGPQNLRRQQELWLREAEKEVEAREAAKRAEQEARKKTLAKCALTITCIHAWAWQGHANLMDPHYAPVSSPTGARHDVQG